MRKQPYHTAKIWRKALQEVFGNASAFSNKRKFIVNFSAATAIAALPFMVFPTAWAAVPLAAGGMVTFALIRTIKRFSFHAPGFGTYAFASMIGIGLTGIFTLTSFSLHEGFGPGAGYPAGAVKKDAVKRLLKPGNTHTVRYKGNNLLYVVEKIENCKRGLLRKDFEKISLKYHSTYKDFWRGKNNHLTGKIVIMRPAESTKNQMPQP